MVSPTHVRISVRGRLSERFAAAFEGMALEPDGRNSVLVGEVTDAAALYGVIDRLRDLGLELTGVSTLPRRHD